MVEQQTKSLYVMGSSPILTLLIFTHKRKVRRKMNNLVKQSQLFVKRNASTILTCVGGVGVVATSIMAVKATPKALRLIEVATEEKGEELTKLEVVKVAGSIYIPSVVTGIATLACIFGANVLNKRQQAALMSAYALLDNSYREYKNKVVELYGEAADIRIREELAKDKYEEADISEDDGKQLFYDEFSERYFHAKMEDVIRAEYAINRKISVWGGAALNEFYEELDIPEVDYGNFLGWSSGGLMEMTWSDWLDFTHEKVVMDDGLECHIISISVEPMFDYEYY